MADVSIPQLLGNALGIPESTVAQSPPSRRVAKLSTAILLWVGLLLALNTGGGAVAAVGRAKTPLGYLHAARSLVPVLAVLAWLLLVAGRSKLSLRRPGRVEACWLFYGSVGLAAGLARPDWVNASFWGLAYCAPFLVTELLLYGEDRATRLLASRRLNQISWTVVLLVLIFYLVLTGEDLLQLGSGYGIFTRVENLAGMPMVRSSGLGRMSGILTVVAYGAMLFSTGRRFLLWGIAFLVLGGLTWYVQSRGSLVAVLGGLVLVSLVAHSVDGFLAAIVLAGLSFALMGVTSPGAVEELVRSGFRMGWEGLFYPSGREDIWRQAWTAFKEASLFGYGFQADRVLLGRNAQSGIFYPLLTGGLLGGGAYLMGLILLWKDAIFALRKFDEYPLWVRRTLLQAVGICALFTVRHYPENTSALFSLDLLIMVPAILFISELRRSRAWAGATEAGT